MNDIFHLVIELVQKGEVLISDHGYDELAADHLFFSEILAGITEGKGQRTPAVLVTAYRPDPDRWSTDILRRKG